MGVYRAVLPWAGLRFGAEGPLDDDAPNTEAGVLCGALVPVKAKARRRASVTVKPPKAAEESLVSVLTDEELAEIESI